MIDKKAIENVIELLKTLHKKADTIKDADAKKDINEIISDFIIKNYDDILNFMIEANKNDCKMFEELF